MSLHLPSRRLFKPAISLLRTPPTQSAILPLITRRTLFGWGRKKDNLPTNALTEDFLKKKPAQKAPKRGDLASSSIFEDEEAAGPKPATLKSKDTKDTTRDVQVRDPQNMAFMLDPDPSSRERWERKMVIREIRKRGRLTKKQILKRTERESLSKSHFIKTSVKKLMLLARQVAGKNIDDAITQMRFSKKKAAKEVRGHLIHARNEAIVRRGMALSGEDKEAEPVQIQTKKGKRIAVKNPSDIYIDQAWVGKGTYGVETDFRARGRAFEMKNRTTSISVVLKEEATRIRQHKEREERIKNRKPWVQLPNRPVTAQRQYYSW